MYRISAIVIPLALMSHCAPALSSDDIVVRANSSLPNALIAYVAKNAVPTLYDRKGLPIDVVTRTVCGFWNQALDDQVRALNPQAAADNFPAKVLLPACIYTKRNAVVNVFDDDDLDVLLRRETGVVPAFQQRCASDVSSPRCGQTIDKLVAELNPGVDLLNLKPSSTIAIPYRTRDTSIRFKELDPKIVLEKVRTLAEGTAIARLSSAPALVQPMSKDDTTVDADCRASTTLSRLPWPFDADMLSIVLTRNVKMAEKRRIKLVPSVVAVLDTGILGKGEFLPNRYFAINSAERERPIGDLDNDGYNNDVIGANVAARYGDVAPYPNDPFREHGSAVANLVLGGRTFRTRFTSLEKLVQLKIVKIVKSSQEQHETDIPETAIAAGLKYASRMRASVANISSGGSRKNSEILGYLNSKPSIVAVVAAGNRPELLDDDPKYPANFGGVFGRNNNIITVVAHDGLGKRASFSNFGAHYADIAAPGCDLPYKGKNAIFGTSFATPLVSFAVALMRTFWNFDDVYSPSVKERLEASIDFDPALVDDVTFSGRLNIIKAVNVFDDVVQLKDKSPPGKSEAASAQTGTGNYLLGAWNVALDLCDGLSDFGDHMADVRKVTPLDGGSRLRVLYHTRAGNMNPLICKPASPTLIFSDENQHEHTLAWANVVDLVPRMRRNLPIQGPGTTNILQ